MTHHVEDIDHGWKRIQQDMRKAGMSPLVVDVGIIGSEAEEQHESFLGKEDATNAEVGATHEYGAPGKGWRGADIPERSFIRATVDEKHNDIDRLFQRAAKGALGDKIKLKRGLGLVGEKVVALIKAKIRKGISPPLSNVTIELRKKQFGKASTKQLIATSQLMGSITHVVRKPSEGAK